jgi:hypothetical protein
MCQRCWSHEYEQRPEVKARRKLLRQKPENKEKKRLYNQHRSQRVCIECNTLTVIHGHDMCQKCCQEIRRMNAKIVECPGCGQEKKIFRIGMCRPCYDYQRYGGEENYKEAESLRHAERRREDPEESRRSTRRWKERHPEQYRIMAMNTDRRRWPFRAKKPIGPFDPNEIRDKLLQKALDEVRRGDLSLPSRPPLGLLTRKGSGKVVRSQRNISKRLH